MRLNENAFLVLSLLAIALLANHCRHTDSRQISGTLRLADQTYLPEGSIVLLRLMDANHKGGDALLLEKRLVLDRSAPAIPFELPVDLTTLPSGVSCVLHASLQVDGQLTHTSRQYRIERDHPAADSIRLVLYSQ